MSYSRWGGRGSGYWYTFWLVQAKVTENRDTAIFAVCTTACFTAKELREDMDGCLRKVKEFSPDGDTDELKIYMTEFLADVDAEYPPNSNGDGIAPASPPPPSSVVVSLGDLYADACCVCGQRGEWGMASQHGPDGCVEAIESGKVYCEAHLPQNMG